LEIAKEEVKNNMFMAWKERSSPHIKVKEHTTKILKEVMTTMRKSIS
jgi:hypothetical protein